MNERAARSREVLKDRRPPAKRHGSQAVVHRPSGAGRAAEAAVAAAAAAADGYADSTAVSPAKQQHKQHGAQGAAITRHCRDVAGTLDW